MKLQRTLPQATKPGCTKLNLYRQKSWRGAAKCAALAPGPNYALLVVEAPQMELADYQWHKQTMHMAEAPPLFVDPLLELADDETDRIITDPEGQTRAQQQVRDRFKELMDQIKERFNNAAGSSDNSDNDNSNNNDSNDSNDNDNNQ